jgi:hypothetical protein
VFQWTYAAPPSAARGLYLTAAACHSVAGRAASEISFFFACAPWNMEYNIPRFSSTQDQIVSAEHALPAMHAVAYCPEEKSLAYGIWYNTVGEHDLLLGGEIYD